MTKECAKSDKGQHCYHRGNYTFTSIPEQWDETCCHCGDSKRVTATIPGVPIGHGPHHPKAHGNTWAQWMPTGDPKVWVEAFTITNNSGAVSCSSTLVRVP